MQTEPPAPGVSGTHAILGLTQRVPPPLPARGQANTPSAKPQDRAEQLAQELAQARQQIAQLRAERNELKRQLDQAVAELAAQKPTFSAALAAAPSEPPLGLDELDDRVALLPDSLPAPPPLPAIVSSAAPASFVEASPLSSGDGNLARVVVSTRPAADVLSEDAFRISELPGGLRPSSADRPSSTDRPSSADRRRRGRHGAVFEVEFLGDSHLISGLTQDISEGGMFVATYQELVIGTTIALALELPNGRVQVRGEVCWKRGESEDSEQRPGFGVAFKELSAEAVSALTEFCRSHPAHYYEM